MSELIVVQTNLMRARKESEAPLRWENMTKPERQLYLQAEKEYETGTVSSKILTQAKEKCDTDDADGLERHYVLLRYLQLREQCAELQRKIAKRQARDKISRIAIPERVKQKKSSGMLGTTITWTLVFLGGLAVVGAVALAVLSFVS